MNKNETQILIDRYLNGVTTPEEEKQLARALLGDDIPEEWKVVQIMLGELAMGEAEYDADVAEDASRRKSFMLPMTARWLIAASVALLVGFASFIYIGRNEERSIAEVKSGTAVEQKTKNYTCKNDSAIKQRTTIGQNLLADNTDQDTYKPLSAPKQHVAHDITGDAESMMDEDLHYASMTVNDSPNNYQAPSRMEEFIMKLADYHRVKGERLPYSSSEDDSLTVSTAYVFNDTKELNLFSRLLQAACWYEDTTPGYLLNYSHQQFFFQLKDLRLGMQYLWIAERIRGRILLYSTRSPLDTEVSSDGFREYRDRLSNTSIKF